MYDEFWDEDEFRPYQSYDEQLSSVEWRFKRNAILKRDNHKCLKCSNEQIFSKSMAYHYYGEGSSRSKKHFFGINLQLEDIKEFELPSEAYKVVDDQLSKCIFYYFTIKAQNQLQCI